MRAIRMLMAMAVVLVAMPMAAQGNPGGMGGGQGGGQGGGVGGNQQRMMQMLLKDITVTPAQQAKIDTLQTANRASMMEMMQSGGMQDPANRERMQASRAKLNTDIRAVLTPAQQVQFDKNIAEMPAAGAGRRPPPSPPVR